MPKLITNNRKKRLKDLEEYVLHSLKEESVTPGLVLDCCYFLYPDRRWGLESSNRELRSNRQAYRWAFSSLMLLCIKHKIHTSAGFVYAITHPKHPNAVKIGSTQDCEDRLGTYQTYCPNREFSLDWSEISFDRRADEKELLSRFASSLKGEWACVDYSNKLELSKQLNEFVIDYG